MTQSINAILFDLGETLLEFGKVDLPAMFLEGGKLAYDYLKTFGTPLPNFKRYQRRHLREIHWHELIGRITKREFNSLHVMDRLCRRMNLKLTHEQLLEVCWCWYEPLSKLGWVEDGVPELLRDFHAQGIKIGMVSNTFIPGEVLDRHLAMVSLLDLLPMRVYSSDVGWRKPNRRIFNVALERIQTSAAETIFVGDSPKFDVRGSNRLGMISVLKDPAGKHAGSWHRPAHTIKSILELRDVVSQYR